MKRSRKILWKSSPIPKKLVDDDDWLWRLYEKAQQLSMTDTPDTKDLRAGCLRYNESTPAERDAMDQVFVWFTGYTLASIAQDVSDS